MSVYGQNPYLAHSACAGISALRPDRKNPEAFEGVTACGLTALGGALGRLEGVDLGAGASLGLDMGGKIAASANPLFGGHGVA